MPPRFIERQLNSINNDLMREISFGKCISTKGTVQKNRHQKKKKEKEIQRLSQKLNNKNLRSLSVISNNKKIEYFPEKSIIIKGSR
jgi:hypothetical protein